MEKIDDPIKAYIGEGTILKGSLSFSGTVRVDGKIEEGRVDTDGTLIIGETGHLIGEIFAGTVVCMGHVEGPIVASKQVEIHSKGKVVGNIKSPALSIELGGVLTGLAT